MPMKRPNVRYRAFVKWLDHWNIFIATAMLVALLYAMSLVSCSSSEHIMSVSSSHTERHDTVLYDTLHVQRTVASYDTVHVTGHAIVHTVVEYDTVGRPMRLTRDEDNTFMADRLSALQMHFDSLMASWRYDSSVQKSDSTANQSHTETSEVTDALESIRKMIGYVLAAIFFIFLIYCFRCLGQYLNKV